MFITSMIHICSIIFLSRQNSGEDFLLLLFGLGFVLCVCIFFFLFCLTKTKCSPAMRQRKKSILAMYHVTNRIRGMIYVWMDAAWISWGLAQRARKREGETEEERAHRGRWGGVSWTVVIISTVRPDCSFFSCSNNPLLQHCRTWGKPAIRGLWDGSAPLRVPMSRSH